MAGAQFVASRAAIRRHSRGSLQIATTLAGDVSQVDAAFQASYRAALAARFGVPEAAVQLFVTSGSVQLLVVRRPSTTWPSPFTQPPPPPITAPSAAQVLAATEAQSVAALSALSQTTFADATAAASFISGATGAAVTVETVSTASYGSDDGDGDDDGGRAVVDAHIGVVIGICCFIGGAFVGTLAGYSVALGGCAATKRQSGASRPASARSPGKRAPSSFAELQSGGELVAGAKSDNPLI